MCMEEAVAACMGALLEEVEVEEEVEEACCSDPKVVHQPTIFMHSRRHLFPLQTVCLACHWSAALLLESSLERDRKREDQQAPTCSASICRTR